MNAERRAILKEIRERADHPNELVNDRVDSISLEIENNPPTSHHYLTLGAVAYGLIAAGIVLIAAGVFGVGAISTPNGSNPVADEQLRLVVGAALVIGIVFGLMLISYGQLMKLLLDLQENADRQSFILHGIYFLLRDRKDQ
jgi:hypothetical protein